LAVKVGFAGCGYIAGVHMANLKRDQRVEITCTYDPDPARAGAIGVKDFDELLSRVDAVYVTAPNTLHAELARKTIAAGRHVFCEKPMATTLDAARQVLEAAQAAQTVFQVGFNRRFAPVYRRVKELLQSAPPHCAHIKMNRGELLKPVWTGDEQITGGFLFETPIHMFDMMRFQFGDVAAITARLSRENDFSMLIEFQSGLHATFVTRPMPAGSFPTSASRSSANTPPSRPKKWKLCATALASTRRREPRTIATSPTRSRWVSPMATACLSMPSSARRPRP
jgi:myo-inositol 2-dehydrogenase/D-chiro-inositol 1-dehydrogenase